MNQQFNSKDRINHYVDYIRDELMRFNTRIFLHWSDLTDEMKQDFIDTFGEKNCKNFNYFIVIWSNDWKNWEVYMADDVFALMQFANRISKYYYGDDFDDFTEKLLQLQEIILKYTIGGKDGKRNQSQGVTSQQIKSQGRTFAKAAS